MHDRGNSKKHRSRHQNHLCEPHVGTGARWNYPFEIAAKGAKKQESMKSYNLKTPISPSLFPKPLAV